MICNKCNSNMPEGTKFCTSCGNNLTVVQPSPVDKVIQDVNVQQTPIVETPVNTQNTVVQQQVNNINITNNTHVNPKGFMAIILAVILKPFTALKEELSKFNSFKDSAILAVIVTVAATLISLITKMFNAVRVKSFSFTGGGETTWQFENLKNLDYIKIIGKDLLIFAGIILAIAIVYYIASLIVKKQTSFPRLLGISSLAVTPLLICYLVLSPLLTMIHATIGIIISIMGAVYTIVILYEAMNEEILLEGNAKIYFNFTCLSLLISAGYYVYMKVITSAVTSGLGDLMDMFGY